LSTKWRRCRKHSRWLNAVRNIDEIENRNFSRALRVENLRVKRGLSQCNLRFPRIHDKKGWREPKPLIDVLQEKDWVVVVAELAGFNKETLKIHVRDQKLTLSARAKDRRYYKSLNLPKIVIPNIMRTAYKNGVLEVRLKSASK
jgi:HSP20 family molecular chaperone IbpA